jgi:hypothetical protein
VHSPTLSQEGGLDNNPNDDDDLDNDQSDQEIGKRGKRGLELLRDALEVMSNKRQKRGMKYVLLTLG